MNLNQHRKLAETLTDEANDIHRQLLEELGAEVNLSQAEQDAIVWTGEVRIFGQSVWHLFKTPGSWNGVTYYRLPAFGEGNLKSREVEYAEDYEGHQRDYPLSD